MEDLLHLLREKGQDRPHSTYFEGLQERIVAQLHHADASSKLSVSMEHRPRRFVRVWGPAGGLVALLIWGIWVVLPGAEEGPVEAQAVAEPPEAPVRVVQEGSGVSTNGAPAGLFEPNSEGVLPASGR